MLQSHHCTPSPSSLPLPLSCMEQVAEQVSRSLVLEEQAPAGDVAAAEPAAAAVGGKRHSLFSLEPRLPGGCGAHHAVSRSTGWV